MSNWQQQLYDETMKRRGLQSAAPVSQPQPQIIRQSKKEPNKTERRFEMEYLKPWLLQQQIEAYDFEAITLKIANGCKYTPDWYVWPTTNVPLPDGYPKPRFYEIKARKMIWDDAIVKLKVAAATYPQFQFFLCAWDSKTGWIIQEVLA